jgi:predicted P-loop ATPase/GTPase
MELAESKRESDGAANKANSRRQTEAELGVSGDLLKVNIDIIQQFREGMNIIVSKNDLHSFLGSKISVFVFSSRLWVLKIIFFKRGFSFYLPNNTINFYSPIVTSAI